MKTRTTSGRQAGIWRPGRTDPVLAGLLGAVVVALVALIVVVLLQGRRDTGADQSQPPAEAAPVASGQTGKQEKPSSPPVSQPPPETPAVAAGQTVKREEIPSPPPPPPKTVGKPDRLREILQPGKTYEAVATVDLADAVREREWGIDRTVHLVYRTETLMHRQIEKNDGKQIVEVRTFVDCKAVKITSTVEISFKNLAPGVMFLSDLFFGDDPLVGIAVALGLDVVRGWITSEAQRELDSRNTKVRGTIESLTGKKVRIVYEDGKGVVELTPIDCSLTQEQQDFLLAAAVVTDAYWLPDVESRPGQAWNVPGEALSDLVPPSWKAMPEGNLTIRRERDFTRDGKQYALLRLEKGSVTVNATDARRSRLGSLTPEGSLEYNITDGHVSKAELTAKGSIEEVSKDHLLFESRFEAAPKVRMTYSCRILP